MTKEQQELCEANDWDIDEVNAYLELGIGDDDLSDFDEARQGHHKNDEDFVWELLESTGDLPKDLPPYIHIDIEATARDIMMDYSEQDGYYFRNL